MASEAIVRGINVMNAAIVSLAVTAGTRAR